MYEAKKPPGTTDGPRKTCIFIFFIYVIYEGFLSRVPNSHKGEEKVYEFTFIFTHRKHTQKEVWGVENCKIMRESVAGIKRQKEQGESE